MKTSNAVVIGAGMGGIAAAGRLARHGYRVTVIEKGSQAGGRCNRLVRDGHHFDTGPTLFLMPELFVKAFSDLGERMEEHLDLRRIDPTYRIHFGDGSDLALTGDLAAMQAQLEALEPGSFDGFLRYMEQGRVHYELALPNLVERHFHRPLDLLRPRKLWPLLKLNLLTRHYGHMKKYFNDRRLKAAFTFQDLYLSLNPYQAPATYSLLSYAELSEGVWFPQGGMYRIVEALVSIAKKHGAQFVYNTSVQQINTTGRRATGVTLDDGQQIQADVVIANADLPYVYAKLLPDDGASAKLERKKYTCSAITFYWGLDKQYPQLESHNLFLADDYRQSFDSVLEDHTLPDDPCFYAHTPVRMDPALAPAGQDSLMIVVPVGHINAAAPQDWEALQKRARQKVLQRLAKIGATDLEQHIKFEVSYTPRDWQSRYNLTRGATLGLAHGLTQMGPLRPRNRHARYHNLYFVGANTHPGAGLANALISARLASERVAQEIGVPRAAPVVAPAPAW